MDNPVTYTHRIYTIDYTIILSKTGPTITVITKSTILIFFKYPSSVMLYVLKQLDDSWGSSSYHLKSDNTRRSETIFLLFLRMYFTTDNIFALCNNFL